VGRIRLHFPLDLRIDDVLAVGENGDTLLSAGTIGVDVRLAPLFKKEVEIDEVMLVNVSMNSGDMIEGCRVWGEIGELSIESHGVDLDSGLVVLNSVNLSDTDMSLMLADSVSADSAQTDSAGTNWRIDLRSLNFCDVALSVMLPPSADSVSAAIDIGRLELAGMLDLGKGIYDVGYIDLNNSSLKYDVGTFCSDSALLVENTGLQPDHILLSDLNVRLDSLMYCESGDMRAVLSSLSACERSGVCVNGSGSVHINDGILSVPELVFGTDNSILHISAKADIDALGDGRKNGVLSVKADGHLSKKDITTLFPAAGSIMEGGLPESPAVFALKADGTTGHFEIESLEAKMENVFSMKAGGSITNVADIANMGIESHFGI
jgi:hypothetical protein